MEKSTASLIPNILERKVVEKNRRDKMKLLYSQLFSLVPDHFKSKETVEISERVNETINYIESLKANIKKTKEEASTSSQMSHGIEIHEMSPDLYVVVVTGLETPSVFFDIVRVLDGYSTDVVQANFSPRGPSTFHVHHNNIEATYIYRTLNELLKGSCQLEEQDIEVAPSNKDEENLDLWDIEICSDVWFRNS